MTNTDTNLGAVAFGACESFAFHFIGNQKRSIRQDSPFSAAQREEHQGLETMKKSLPPERKAEYRFSRPHWPD